MPDTASHSSDWHRLNAASTWLAHVAKPRAPHSSGTLAHIWQAILNDDIPHAMAMAQAAFSEDASPELCEVLGLLCLTGRNPELAQTLFSHAPSPITSDWRNRGVFALWGRDWDAAAKLFAKGIADTTEDAYWCRAALITMHTIARHWTSVLALNATPLPQDHELSSLVYLCVMAAKYGRDGQSANLMPDIDMGLLSDAPPVSAPNTGCGTLSQSLSAELIGFLACDPGYLERYGLAAVIAFAQAHTGQTLAFHLHLYDPTPRARQQITDLSNHLGLKLALTEEDSPQHVTIAERGTYYACARFCRLAEAMPSYTAPVVAIDADALIRKDLTPLTHRVPHIGITLSPLTVPWNRHPAGFLLLQPTEPARAFLCTAASLIGDSLARGQRLWFLDQWALLIAAQHPAHTGHVRHFPWQWTYNTEFTDNAYVWQANDSRKHMDTPYTRAIQNLRQDWENV